MDSLEITAHRPELTAAFTRLNREWIEELFHLEPKDLRVLESPEQTILAAGGEVYFALAGGEPVGCCAVLRAGEGRWELGKMAVDPAWRGRGIGEAVGRAVVEHARRHDATLLFLETNSSLAGAIRLYERLGFRHADPPEPSPYARADVYMEIRFGRP